jgi:hypothetical protein
MMPLCRCIARRIKLFSQPAFFAQEQEAQNEMKRAQGRAADLSNAV